MSFQTLVSGCLITLAPGPSVHRHLLFIHVIKYLCFSFFCLISESFNFFMLLTLQKVTIREVQARLLLYALVFSLSLFLFKKIFFHFTYQLQLLLPSFLPPTPISLSLLRPHILLKGGTPSFGESTKSEMPSWSRIRPLPPYQVWAKYHIL